MAAEAARNTSNPIHHQNRGTNGFPAARALTASIITFETVNNRSGIVAAVTRNNNPNTVNVGCESQIIRNTRGR
jgi:hypothetical protein